MQDFARGGGWSLTVSILGRVKSGTCVGEILGRVDQAYAHTALLFSSRGGAAFGPPRSGGRARGRGFHFMLHFLCLMFLFLFELVVGVYKL